MSPASPFVSPQQPHPLHHQQQCHNNNNSSSSNSSASSHTSNNNTTNSHHPPHSGAVASRFSPPLQNSHSQALPGRHLAAGGGAAHPLQAVQQHQQQQTYHPHPHSLVPHSRPSLPLSPNPSPHQAGPQYSQPFSQAVEYDVLRPPLVPEQLPPHISPAGILSGAVSAEDLDWHLSQSFQYPTLDVVVSPTTQSSWEEEHTQRMTPPEAVGAGDASGSTHRHPPMDPGSATTHRFHSTHPRSPTHSQSLGSEHLDPIALTVAAATMMHSDVLGGRCSPTTAHAFRSGRRPSHGHRLRIHVRFHSIWCNFPLPSWRYFW